MHWAPKKMTPGQTMSENKTSFPNLYWWYTFDGMHIYVKKMNEKIRKKTNGKERI
jgi:hypothetical protein